MSILELLIGGLTLVIIVLAVGLAMLARQNERLQRELRLLKHKYQEE